MPDVGAAGDLIRRSARRRRLRRGLLVSLFTVVILTLGCELVLRLTGDREDALQEGMNRTNRRWTALTRAGIFEQVDDDARRYAMRPGASCEVDGWTFRVTSHRTRGADFPAAKPPDERRILALGDSFCFGMWCDEDETLVGHLARMANEREAAAGSGITWRAVNCGVPGYHSGQQRLALEQDGLALAPDVVVLYFNSNDIAQEGYFYDAELGALRSDYLPLPTWLRRPLWRSHLYGWIVRKHYHALRSVPEAPFDPRVPWAHVREDNQRYTRAAIEGIARTCRERGIPLFFVDQPFMTWSGATLDPEWRGLELVAWAEGVRADLELPGVNLLGWLRGYADGVDRFPDRPADFLPDAYIADPAVELAVERAAELARSEGRTWAELTLDEVKGYVQRSGVSIPDEVDFHLTGAGYGHIARLCYPPMQAAGMLP